MILCESLRSGSIYISHQLTDQEIETIRCIHTSCYIRPNKVHYDWFSGCVNPVNITENIRGKALKGEIGRFCDSNSQFVCFYFFFFLQIQWITTFIYRSVNEMQSKVFLGNIYNDDNNNNNNSNHKQKSL